uniref:Uncharacterized protein n=1 Tax=Meloidogyne incognita TaxID=6306 RepID=A0A914NMH2_MELIC
MLRLATEKILLYRARLATEKIMEKEETKSRAILSLIILHAIFCRKTQSVLL